MVRRPRAAAIFNPVRAIVQIRQHMFLVLQPPGQHLVRHLQHHFAMLRVAGAMKEQADFAARLAHQATHDDLTGLPNRTLIVNRLDMLRSESHRTGQPVALMFLDLDQFKLVNDSMGHVIGDELLVRAG